MQENYLDKLKDIASSFRRINGKIKLLSLLNRAKKEYDSNNYETCEATCLEILKSNPKNSVALRGLGCVAQVRGEYSKAEKFYKEALVESKNKEIEYTLLGTIFYIQEDLDKALYYYNLAIDCNDDYEKAYEGRNQTMLENHLKIIDLQDSLIKRNLF